MGTTATAACVVNRFLARFMSYGWRSCGLWLAVCRGARASILTRARHVAREGVGGDVW